MYLSTNTKMTLRQIRQKSDNSIVNGAVLMELSLLIYFEITKIRMLNMRFF